MVIGAGAAGQAILREMRNSEQISGQACCVIDDNPNKWGRYMEASRLWAVVMTFCQPSKNMTSTNLFCYSDSFPADPPGYPEYLQRDKNVN